MFQHSGETISQYFGETLDILNLLSKEIINLLNHDFKGVTPEKLRDMRYMSYFNVFIIIIGLFNYLYPLTNRVCYR